MVREPCPRRPISIRPRIDALAPSLHAYVTVMADAARERAAALDAKRAAGEPLGVLHGAPIGLKDLLFTRGVRTTGGMRIHDGFVPDRDATVVQRLEAAGAVFLGKLKLTEPDDLLEHIAATPGPAIYALCDFHPYLDDAKTIASRASPVAGGVVVSAASVTIRRSVYAVSAASSCADIVSLKCLL